MAKTWTLREAYEKMAANDKSAIMDFGKRFPLATAALAKSGVNDGLNVLMSAFPDRVTMRTLEMALKDGVAEIADDEDAEVEAPAEKPVKKEKKQTAEKAEKPAKKAEKATKTAKKAEKVEEAPVEDAEGDKTDYSEMGAVDLFKLCKKRGIKVEPKQKASVYIKALEADDAKATEAEDEDDWSDDAEDEKPAKSAKKPAKAKKADDDDDDSDWDI